MKRPRRSFSTERHRRQTQARLIFGGLLILVLVGGGLVWAIYGRAAALTAIGCLLTAAGLFGLLWLILTLLERWVKEDEP
jgi:protein-S-isoprenylcysteine O-methyltransferase Ste14